MGQKILIVDDEPLNRKLLEVMLKSEGYHVLSAGNGEEGLALVDQQRPDLILLDIRMPEQHDATLHPLSQ